MKHCFVTLLSAILFVAVLSAPSGIVDDGTNLTWSQYKEKFGKEYSEDEDPIRKQRFLKCQAKVRENNANGKDRIHRTLVNEYCDMTFDQALAALNELDIKAPVPETKKHQEESDRRLQQLDVYPKFGQYGSNILGDSYIDRNWRK